MSVLEAHIEAAIVADLEAGYWNPFEQISEEDREYMRRPVPQPCVWCGGRHRHNPLCVSLSEEFTVRLGFGKHAGKAVRDVPKDYLRWLVRKKISLDPDVKREVHEFLNIPLFDEVQT